MTASAHNIQLSSIMTHICLYDDEFPLLEDNGLYAAQTSGDGDCLFHALSDQLYGHENSYHDIRMRVVEHLRSHKSYFEAFIGVSPARRAPRRRAAANSKADLVTHSQDEIDKAFEHRLQRMQKSGFFGDNLEIQAFAREYRVNVKIYQRDHAYVICSLNGDDGKYTDTQVVHIAYHTWEHYSSIRNREGPYTGPPNVSGKSSSQTAEAIKKKLAASAVLPWMEAVVAKTLPYTEFPEKIRDTLEKYKGNVNEAAACLMDAWEKENGNENENVSDSGKSTQSSTETKNFDEKAVAKRQVPEPKMDAPRLEEGQVSAYYENESMVSIQAPIDDFQESDSRIKRRKSPDGTPISATNEYAHSTKSSSSSDSGITPQGPIPLATSRRRKSASPTSLSSANSGLIRRSPRLQAQISAHKISNSAPTETSASEISEEPPKSRRNLRKSKRTAGRKKSEGAKIGIGTMQTVTVGIRELYV